MHIKTYFVNWILTVKDKDLYKFLGGKLRPLDGFRKWEEEVMKALIGKTLEKTVCFTLDGGENPRDAWRYFTIEKCMELTEDPILKEKLWNMS